MDIINSILRSFISYILLVVCTRLMGRKLIAQMTFFDFAVAITIGTIAASLALGTKYTPVSAVVVVLTFTVLSLATSFIHIKSIKARKIINSEPIVVIVKGEMIIENMKKIRININDLNMKLREKDVFSIADVEFAIIETDGELSVLLKSIKQPLTPWDMNINKPDMGLSKDVVIDGRIIHKNISLAGKNEQWLMKELNKSGINNLNEVFYACIDMNNNLHISRRGNKGEKAEYGIE